MSERGDIPRQRVCVCASVIVVIWPEFCQSVSSLLLGLLLVEHTAHHHCWRTNNNNKSTQHTRARTHNQQRQERQHNYDVSTHTAQHWMFSVIKWRHSLFDSQTVNDGYLAITEIRRHTHKQDLNTEPKKKLGNTTCVSFLSFHLCCQLGRQQKMRKK